jgi:hypothetical protein
MYISPHDNTVCKFFFPRLYQYTDYHDVKSLKFLIMNFVYACARM